MIPKQLPVGETALLFADRGASAQLGENTIESFAVARRLGATAIESDLHSSADGFAVLRRSPRTAGMRRRRVAEVSRSQLGDSVVTLEEFYEQVGDDLDILLHVHDADAVEAALHSATRFRALDRLWLASADLEALAQWRERSELVRLVHEIGPETFAGGAERHAAALRSQRVDATMADRSLWNGGRVALYHRFTRRCFAQNAVHERMAVTLFHIGLDGVSSAHPDRLVDAHREVTRPDAPPVRED
ncbi:MAG: hypothetical protein M9952_08225 [Microthrixaceae bacterium]|nr:hypothetical protein [Microthrixaceae bacterium]MCO5312904.1 hypothetical protein [Microthrixaceae bacterium]